MSSVFYVFTWNLSPTEYASVMDICPFSCVFFKVIKSQYCSYKGSCFSLMDILVVLLNTLPSSAISFLTRDNQIQPSSLLVSHSRTRCFPSRPQAEQKATALHTFPRPPRTTKHDDALFLVQLLVH